MRIQGGLNWQVQYSRRVRLPDSRLIAAVAYGYEPPREVTFPIRPHLFSVGLFSAASSGTTVPDRMEKSRFAM